MDKVALRVFRFIPCLWCYSNAANAHPLVVVAFSSLAKILRECSTIHFLPALLLLLLLLFLFFFFFKWRFDQVHVR